VRRCLHAFLVGVLMLSTSMNAARACWYLRHGSPARHHGVIAYPPHAVAHPVPVYVPVMIHAPVVEVGGVWGDGCGDVVAVWPADDVVVETPLVADDCSCDCGGTVVDESFDLGAEIPVEDHVGEATVVDPVVENVIHHEHPAVDGHVTETVAAQEPTLAEPLVEKTAPTPAAVPVLESTEEVRQAAAFGEPGRKPEPEVVLPAEPAQDHAAEPLPAQDEAPAVESNIFEEVDQTGAGAAVTGAEQVVHEASARPASREAARRWIDRSGDYAVVGTLRAVRGDGTCELEAAGRTIEVPLEALSEFDRAYVTAASERLAVRTAPESVDTAGL